MMESKRKGKKASRKAASDGGIKGEQSPAPVDPVKFKSTQITSFPMASELEKILRCCSTCKKIPASVFYTCETGHITCAECYKRILLCSHREANMVCGKRLLPTKCHILSEITKATELVCPGNDCKKVLFGHEIPNHAVSCEGMSTLECLFSICSKSEIIYNRRGLLTHLLDEHKCRMFQTTNGLVRYEISESIMASRDDGVWKVAFIMKYNDTIFVCVYGNEFIRKNLARIIIVYWLSLNSNATHYDRYGTIKYTSSRLTSREYTGLLPIINTAKETAVQAFNCLVVPVEPVPTGSFYIQVQIKDSATDFRGVVRR